jgi:N-acetyl-gamma-glutamyl-phosphate reductase
MRGCTAARRPRRTSRRSGAPAGCCVVEDQRPGGQPGRRQRAGGCQAAGTKASTGSRRQACTAGRAAAAAAAPPGRRPACRRPAGPGPRPLVVTATCTSMPGMPLGQRAQHLRQQVGDGAGAEAPRRTRPRCAGDLALHGLQQVVGLGQQPARAVDQQAAGRCRWAPRRRRPRSSSRAPRRTPARATCSVTVGGARCRALAAAAKEPRSATASRVRRRSRLILAWQCHSGFRIPESGVCQIQLACTASATDDAGSTSNRTDTMTTTRLHRRRPGHHRPADPAAPGRPHRPAAADLPEAQRKDPRARAEALNAATWRCCACPTTRRARPCRGAPNPAVRVIDASSAHRTAPGWVYGLPSWRRAGGAHRRGAARQQPRLLPHRALALLRPLVDAGLLPPTQPLVIHAVSGYSGRAAGVDQYEGPAAADAPPFQVYGLGWPQARARDPHHAGLAHAPVFVPAYGALPPGHRADGGAAPATQLPRARRGRVHAALQARYAGQRFMQVQPLAEAADADAGPDRAERQRPTCGWRCCMRTAGHRRCCWRGVRQPGQGRGRRGGAEPGR